VLKPVEFNRFGERKTKKGSKGKGKNFCKLKNANIMGQFDFKEYVEDKYKGHIYQNQKGEDVQPGDIFKYVPDKE